MQVVQVVLMSVEASVEHLVKILATVNVLIIAIMDVQELKILEFIQI